MARPLPSRSDIVRSLASESRALHAREIASRCGVPEGSYSRFIELLDQLTFDGTLRRMSGNRFRARPEASEGGASWEGVLSVNPRGFGFVAAAGQDDVYVAPDGIGGALHGDRVRISVLSRSSRGVEGRIEEIVARRNPRVAGVLRRRGKSTWLEPDDTRVRGPIVLSAAAEGKDGDAAVAAITQFPEFADETPAGELVAVLGVPGSPNAEVAKILIREQIVEAHPEAAMQEAERLSSRVPRVDPQGRVDLRDVPLPTIDPEDARDHDDAVWVEHVDGGYRVWIAIADVAEYVQPGSALDQEAVSRGCTIYLPDRAIPMLPAALSSDLCSLLPEQDRLCMCVIADLDSQGDVRGFDVVEGVMRSAAMLTYGGVARALGFTDQGPRSAQAEAMKRGLRCVDEVSRKLRKKRMRRGALDLDLPEVRIYLDEQSGAPIDVTQRAVDQGVKRAYQMIEELMLLANELVAQWLSKRRSPTIYRVHGKPDEKKLERLAEASELLGAPIDLEQMSDPLGVAKWLRKIHEHPRHGVLEMLLLRSLKQAAYDIANIGHFGLASESYLHFTSPIRRYPDVQVHRAVKHLLRGGTPNTSASAVEALRVSATRASERERAAMEVEREVADLYRALYMRDRIGEVYDGTVSAIVGSGLYVRLEEPFVDVLVRFESLGPDHYDVTENELAVVGSVSGDIISLGDTITVTIEDVAVLRRTVYARRVPPPEVVEPGRRGRGRGRGKKASPGTQTLVGSGPTLAGSGRARKARGSESRGGRPERGGKSGKSGGSGERWTKPGKAKSSGKTSPARPVREGRAAGKPAAKGGKRRR